VTFTVTFNNNGGTGSLASETNGTATALSLFSTGTMAYAGHTFTGWNTAANGSGTAYADGASYPFTASVTLYAQWQLAAAGSLVATFVASASPVTIVPSAGGLVASFVARLTPTLILTSGGNLTATFTASTSLAVVPPAAGGLVALFSASATITRIVYFGAGALAATFVASIAQGQIAVSLPSAQPGATPTTLHLNEHYKMWLVVGVPPSAMGNNGDLAYRKDTATGSGAKVYTRASNAWSAIA
jgi:uncharacterized repeat protein (TIGR02543 family)